jgi:hypothetical protein
MKRTTHCLKLPVNVAGAVVPSFGIAADVVAVRNLQKAGGIAR